MSNRHLVVALAYDGLCTFEFGCTVELFSLARPEICVPWYEFAVCAETPRAMRAMGGITIAVPHSLRLLDRADTIVVPDGATSTRSPRPHWSAASRRLSI